MDQDGRVKKFATTPNIPPPSDDQIKDLLPDRGLSLNAKEREKFRNAHNERTAKPFMPPEIDPLFAHPFVISATKPIFDHPEVRRMFLDSVGSIPGKARHRGFTLAVVGRCPQNWVELWYKGIMYILITRIGPKLAKELSRLPIPKPGK